MKQLLYLMKQGYSKETIRFLLNPEFKKFRKYYVWIAREKKRNPELTCEQIIGVLVWAENTKSDLLRLTYNEARLNAGDSIELLHRYKDERNIVFRDEETGYYIKKLTPAECFKEGKLMRHCVAGYAGQVQHGNVEIYSLRSRNNKPHVTIEIKYGQSENSRYIGQIKGNRNSPPRHKYHKTIVRFIRYLYKYYGLIKDTKTNAAWTKILNTYIFYKKTGLKYDRLEFSRDSFYICGTFESGDMRYGVVSDDAKIMIPPKYEEIIEFDEQSGTALVNFQNENPYLLGYMIGLVDETSEIVPPDEMYKEILFPRDGKIIFQLKNCIWGYIKNNETYIPQHVSHRDRFARVTISKHEGRWGYLNENWEPAIPFEYDYCGPFSEGLASVNKDRKFGAINKNGDVVVPFQYNEVRCFSEGVASAVKDCRFGVVNKNGGIVVPFQYDCIVNFYKGLAYARKDNKYGIINKNGDIVFPFQYDEIKNPCNDWAYARKENKYGIINIDGNIIIPLEYDDIGFSEGLASVKKGDKYGVINKNREIIIPLIYDFCGAFSEGLAVVRTGDKCGAVNKNGEIIIPFEYNRITRFYEGRAFANKDNKSGIINKSGEVLIPFKYDHVQCFSEGLASVKKGDKYGAVNVNGEIIIPYKYDDVGFFSEGLTSVKKGDKYGVINGNGDIVVPFDYDYISDFSGGQAYAVKDDRWGIINSEGKTIVPFEYNEIGWLSEGLIHAQEQDIYKYLNSRNEYITPEKYEFIDDFNNGLAAAMKNGKYIQVNEDGEVLKY